MHVHYGIRSNMFAPVSSSFLSHTRTFSFSFPLLCQATTALFFLFLNAPHKKTNERPREQCYHFMYFFANSMKLMNHLPSRTTFQASNLHTTKYMSLCKWCTLLRPPSTSLNYPISFKTYIPISFTTGLYSHGPKSYQTISYPPTPVISLSSTTTFRYPTRSSNFFYHYFSIPHHKFLYTEMLDN